MFSDRYSLMEAVLKGHKTMTRRMESGDECIRILILR